MSTTPLGIGDVKRIAAEQWNRLLKQVLFDMRCACPGIVQSFDPVKQTITAKLAIREKVVLDLKIEDVEIPLVADVPIIIPRAGDFSLTLPVQAGDECLLFFADMCIDAWWQSGGIQNQAERRRHDLSDAFAILGPWSQPRVLSNYSASSAQLRNTNGTVVIDISDSEVTVTAPKVVVTGSSEVDISGNGVTKIEGKNFLLHTHSGVQTGGGVTGPVE